MSTVYTVVCARPLDPAGSEQLRTCKLPVEIEVLDIGAWRSSFAGEPEALRPALERIAQRPWSFVVRLRCGPAVASVVEVCADALTTAFGGFDYDDTSATITEPKPGVSGATIRDVLGTWTVLFNRPDEADARERKLAKREWTELAASDAAVAADNDWSDV